MFPYLHTLTGYSTNIQASQQRSPVVTQRDRTLTSLIMWHTLAFNRRTLTAVGEGEEVRNY